MTEHSRWSGPICWIHRPTDDGRVMRTFPSVREGRRPVLATPDNRLVGSVTSVGIEGAVMLAEVCLDVDPEVDRLGCGMDLDQCVWHVTRSTNGSPANIEFHAARLIALHVYLDDGQPAWPDAILSRVTD